MAKPKFPALRKRGQLAFLASVIVCAVSFLLPIHPVEAARKGGLAAPASVAALAVSATAVQLTWTDTNTQELAYSIERRTGAGENFAVIALTASNTTSYTDSGLTCGTTYEYRIQATQQPTKPASAYSSVVSATTLSCTPADTLPPAITLTSPIDGAAYSSAQTITVGASASDNVGVARVDFFKNGTQVASDTASPYSYVWDLSAVDNGSHALTAVGFDAANNQGNSAVVNLTVAIDVTPPSVSITSPADGATFTVAETVTITAIASDDSGIERVEFYHDGVLVSSDTSAPFNVGWSVTDLDNGNHAWSAIAYDTSGNQASSSAVTVAVEIATGGPGDYDHIVDAGKLGPNSLIQSKGRMAEFNGTRAFIYAKSAGDKWLYLWDEAGNESRVYLPGLDNDVIENGEYLLTAATELWLFSSNGTPAFGDGAPAVARRYQLGGAGPLPSTAALMETQSFGDEYGVYNGALAFIQLASGALVGAWYHAPETYGGAQDNYIDIRFAYRGTDGVWSVVPDIRVDAMPYHKHRFTLAQHPADGSIWAFSKGDGFEEIWAIHMSENAAGLTLDWVDSQFISQTFDGLDGPEGERPALIAVRDPYSGALLLAYLNNDRKTFSTSPFVKGAKITIARIAADGSRDFLRFPTYVERLDGLAGVVVKPDSLWIAYRPIDLTNFTFYDVYVSRYANGAWETPQFLETTYASGFPNGYTLIAYSVDRARFALTPADNNVHLFTLD